MTDELLKRLRDLAFHYYLGRSVIEEAADRIEALTAERDEAINQLDSAIHSQIVLEKRTAAVMEDRKFILEERDRTFALMLARAEKAELERDALREDVEELDFLRHEGGPDSVAAIEAERDRLAGINVKLCDNFNTLLIDGARLEDRAKAAEAERDRLREALTDAWDAHNKHGDQMSGWWVHDDALKGESHE